MPALILRLIASADDCQNVVPDSGLQHYIVVDIRDSVIPDAIGRRGVDPIGTCVHHTNGVDSRSILTGHTSGGAYPVSSDCLITKTGKRYTITGPRDYAFGTGQIAATIQDRYGAENPNQYLLSAELEYMVNECPTWQQYDSLAEQIILWALVWDWRWPYVLYAHGGIAFPPGRKYDPYAFDWGALMGYLLVRSRAAKIGGL